MRILPISAIIPTLNRHERLQKTLGSLFAQSVGPREIIVVDASPQPPSPSDLLTPPDGVTINYEVADKPGAAPQRNQAQRLSSQPFLLFMDDDIDFEPGCLEALWKSLNGDPTIGGCGVVITNQSYHPPGNRMRRILAWLGCPRQGSLAGRCVGPGLNFLPAMEAENPISTVDWLNLGCTIYRKEALPTPAFLSFFFGYSLIEDATLSLEVGRRWRLATAHAARIFHDSQPAPHKDKVFARQRMEMVNRWFMMNQLLGKRGLGWGLRLMGYNAIILVASLRSSLGWRRLPASLGGLLAGIFIVVTQRQSWRGYPTTTD